MEPEIRYVNHGIGNNFGEVIELNEHLKEWPNLHKAILDHELKHTREVFTKQDFVADMTEHKVDKFELIRFMIANPRSFSQFLPFYYTKERGIVYDINMTLFYSILTVCVGLTLFVGLKYF